MNRLLVVNLNINSISNKFDQLKLFVQGKVDILVITETKLDSTLIETGTRVALLFMFEKILKEFLLN